MEGYQAKPGEIRNVMESWVAPKYFATLGTPLLRGRDFDFQDKGGPRVAIINQTMARYYFGNDDPIGKHVSFDGDGQPYEIVGVAGDAKYMEMREATYRTIYLNTFQERLRWIRDLRCGPVLTRKRSFRKCEAYGERIAEDSLREDCHYAE